MQTAETSASSPEQNLFSPEGLMPFSPVCVSPGPFPLPYRAVGDVSRNQSSMVFTFFFFFFGFENKSEAKFHGPVPCPYQSTGASKRGAVHTVTQAS